MYRIIREIVCDRCKRVLTPNEYSSTVDCMREAGWKEMPGRHGRAKQHFCADCDEKL